MYIQIMDDRLSVLTERQLGVISRRQVLTAGVTQTQLDRLLRRGDLRRVTQGVYRADGSPKTAEQRVIVSALSLAGPLHHAVISHESAATMLGFAGFAHGAKPTLTMPRGGTARSTIARIRTASDLEPTDIAIHSTGLPITTPLRTVIDLALAHCNMSRLNRLLDRSLVDRRVTMDELWHMLLRRERRGRRGIGRVRRALHERSGNYAPAESELEHLAIEALMAHGLPQPFRQHPLPGPLPGRVDLAYPEAMLLVELDGATHMLMETSRHDQRRDATAAVAGWQVMRFGWELVRYDAEWFAASVAKVRRARMRLLGAASA